MISLRNLWQFALLFVFVACGRADKKTDITEVENRYYDQAFDHLDKGQTDSAFIAFHHAKDIFVTQGDSLQAGSCLIQMAIISTDKADYFGGQELSLEALSYFTPTNPDHAVYLSANYNNLGIATYSLDDYPRALEFYDAAIRHSSDSLNTLIYINNKARVYHNMEEYDQAIALYASIEEQTKARPRDYARLLTNLTLARLRQDPQYDATEGFLKALRIREEQNDRSGQHSSYMHLADFYGHRLIDSARYYARKFHATSLALNHADDQLLALQRLIRFSPADSAKRFFDTYTSLSDSVQQARAAAKNQFAVIRYEVEKNKADNLRLKNENIEKAHQVVKQRIWTVGIITVALFVVGAGTFWYRKREQRLKLEADGRLKAHQLKTSRKIHDVVANGLYRLMAEIENKEVVDREDVLDSLEDMYEQSRDISYEQDDVIATDLPFHEMVSGMLKSFATVSTKVIIVGNDELVWTGTNASIRQETNHVLQELMVNMRKHSAATNVAIRFERDTTQLHMFYSDNGAGLPESFKYGNGLTSAGTRMESLGGGITFASEPGKGLKVTITIPVPLTE